MSRHSIARILTLLLAAAASTAAPLSVTATVEPGTIGHHRYSYEIENTGDAALFSFQVFSARDFGVAPGSEIAPTGWYVSVDVASVTWFSLDPAYDLLPGQTLSTLWFESDFPPSPNVSYAAILVDQETAELSLQDGSVAGPVPAVSDVPEPRTSQLIAFLGILALFSPRRFGRFAMRYPRANVDNK